MFRQLIDPEASNATEGSTPNENEEVTSKVNQGARTKIKAKPAQPLMYIRSPVDDQNRHIDHSIDAEKVNERKEVDLTVDDYEGELTSDDFSYIETVMNLSDCDVDNSNLDHLIDACEFGMFINRPSHPDMIKNHFYTCEHFIREQNFEEALGMCAHDLISSVEYNDLTDKFNFCLLFERIGANFKSDDKLKKPVQSFLEAINDRINETIKEFTHEFNEPMVHASFKKGKDFETIFLKWAIKRGIFDKCTRKLPHNNFFRMQYQRDLSRFQDEISKSFPITSNKDGIMLLKFFRSIGKYRQLSIEALKNVETIFKHFDDNRGLAMTYIEMSNTYNKLGMDFYAKKYAKMGNDLKTKYIKLPQVESPRFNWRKLFMKITKKE